MNPPDWLTEFHRRWHAARSRTIGASTRPYGIRWNDLLDAAGITRAEEIKTAAREAEALESSGQLLLKRHRYRHEIIERLVLPLESEPWLHQLFHTEDSARILGRSLKVIDDQSEHPLLPEGWSSLLAKLRASFCEGATLRPFTWRKPKQLASQLDLLYHLTSRTWKEGTLIRSASVDLGYDSKLLERRQHSINAGLSLMFGRPSSLADLGFVMSEAMLLSQGPLILHFDDGESKDFSGLAPHALSAVDLLRAVRIETPCRQLLTIENSKTTFRQFAAADRQGSTLLVASSFPTPVLVALLEKLPDEMEHHHFGDTDPSGYLILRKIREASPRIVHAFHMSHRQASGKAPVSARDRAILDKLSACPMMDDLHNDIRRMISTGDLGDYEQESLGSPTIERWPFY